MAVPVKVTVDSFVGCVGMNLKLAESAGGVEGPKNSDITAAPASFDVRVARFQLVSIVCR